MSRSRDDSERTPTKRALSLNDEQLAAELRAALDEEPDAKTNRMLEKAADQVLRSLREKLGKPPRGDSSRGNSAA